MFGYNRIFRSLSFFPFSRDRPVPKEEKYSLPFLRAVNDWCLLFPPFTHLHSENPFSFLALGAASFDPNKSSAACPLFYFFSAESHDRKNRQVMRTRRRSPPPFPLSSKAQRALCASSSVCCFSSPFFSFFFSPLRVGVSGVTVFGFLPFPIWLPMYASPPFFLSFSPFESVVEQCGVEIAYPSDS